MKFLATILMVPVLAGLAFADDAAVCQKKSPNTMKAIAKFCSNKDLVAPSAYALKGVKVGNSGVMIETSNDCPSAWIPQEYCISQFQHVCATGGATGLGYGRFGYKNSCQIFLSTSNPGKYYNDPVWGENPL